MRALLWLVATTAACGGGNDNTPADSQLPDSGDPCAETPNTRFLMSKATTFGTLPAGAFPGQVCIEGRSDLPCGMPVMQAGGQFLMCVPASGGFGLELVSPMHERIVHLHGEGSSAAGFNSPDKAFAENTIWEPTVPASYPPTDKGFVILGVFLNREPAFPLGIAGGSFTIDPPPAGRALLYSNEEGAPQAGTTETTDAGIAVMSDVEPGMYDITIAGLTNCAITTGAGWESPVGTAQARIPAIAGKTVFAAFYCDDPTP